MRVALAKRLRAAGAQRRIVHRPEEDLQRICAAYLRIAMPAPPEGASWWHVPNQRGTRSRYEMAILKELGVKPGNPDLHFLFRGRFLVAELKAPKGDPPTVIQRACQAELALAGGTVLSDCRSVDQLAAWLASFGVPLRAMPAVLRGRQASDNDK